MDPKQTTASSSLQQDDDDTSNEATPYASVVLELAAKARSVVRDLDPQVWWTSNLVCWLNDAHKYFDDPTTFC